MPDFKDGETREQWMGRCIPVRHKEHPTEKNEQSVAVCYSMWREHEKKQKASLDETEAAKKKKKDKQDEDTNDGKK